MSLSIRPATAGDVALILKFISDLAEYEKLLHEVKATEADILRDLFGAAPKAFSQIAEWDGKPVGFTLWFYTYSTFQGRAGIWLEDLYVEPGLRGKGIGKALLIDLALPKTWGGSNGGCSTGTSPRSSSTARRGRCCRTSGPSAG
jgi:GNAT superfamily N-acetyltransferase